MKSLDLSTIPINVIHRKSKFPGYGYIAKAGVTICNRLGDDYTYCGFSFNSSKENAIKIAKNEVLERVLATTHFNFEYGDYKELYLAKSWPNGINFKHFHRSEIFLGEINNNLLDASGLAFNHNEDDAVIHAICELLERNYLVKIWYLNSLLIKIEGLQNNIDKYSIDYFTLSNRNSLPFILVIIKDCKSKTWLCGSAVALSYEKALEKAFNEACLLQDSMISNDNGYCYSEQTRERLMSLKKPLYFDIRQSFVNEKIESSIEWNFIKNQNWTKYDCSKLLDKTFIQLFVLPIYNDGTNFVMRAISQNVYKIRHARLTLNRPNIPFDPFC